MLVQTKKSRLPRHFHRRKLMKPRSSPVEEAAEEDTQSVCAECPMAEISVASFSCDVQSPSCSASTSIQSPNFRRSMELLCLQLNSTMAESKSCSRKRWKSTLFLRSESVRKTVQTYQMGLHSLSSFIYLLFFFLI